ncbi:MAG: hypothetical protein ACP6IP_01460 [Candidatus Njordarchaeia archaeon]
MYHKRITTVNIKQLTGETITDLISRFEIIILNMSEEELRDHIRKKDSVSKIYRGCLENNKAIIILNNIENLEKVIINYLNTKNIKAKDILLMKK